MVTQNNTLIRVSESRPNKKEDALIHHANGMIE